MNNYAFTIRCQHNGTASDFETMVIKTLLKLGIPANTKGFHYIKTAVILGVENPIGLTSMSKILYPAIAEYYQSESASSIERAMRYAINQSCARGNTQFICEIFDYTDNIQYYNPTNREFLAVVAEYMKPFHAQSAENLIAS